MAKKISRWYSLKCAVMLILSSLMLTMMFQVNAQSAMPPSGNIDTAAFDKILEPVWKVYSFVKYIATAIAAMYLVFAGITYMMSGNDMQKRESAKSMIGFVVLGLMVIWAAPFVVQVLAI